jgi:hypothetical protein
VTPTADVGQFVLQLVQVAVPLVTTLSVVLALRPRRQVSRREATLGRAQWLTVAVVLVVAYLTAVALLRYLETNPLGVLVFLTLGVAVVTGAGILRWAWRAHALTGVGPQWAGCTPARSTAR